MTDATGVITWDARFRPFGTAHAITDPRGIETLYVHDGFGNRIQADSPDAGVTEFEYDLAGNLVKRIDPRRNVTTEYAYDAQGRLVSITDPVGLVTRFTHNSHLTSITDPGGGVTALEYDNLGRQTKLTQPDPDGAGALTSPITLHEYNGSGKISKITDPEGRETTFQFDVIATQFFACNHC